LVPALSTRKPVYRNCTKMCVNAYLQVRVCGMCFDKLTSEQTTKPGDRTSHISIHSQHGKCTDCVHAIKIHSDDKNGASSDSEEDSDDDAPSRPVAGSNNADTTDDQTVCIACKS
jgi:hypothetical protein